jgi:DNA-binding HxlR family transcriptional regulator
MEPAHFDTNVAKVRAAVGEPPEATVILSLAEHPLRRDQLVRALVARGVATTWLSDAALAGVLRQLISDGAIRQRSTVEGEPGAYELTSTGRNRAGIIRAFFERLAGFALPG